MLSTAATAAWTATGSSVSEMWSIPGRTVTGTSLPAVLKTAANRSAYDASIVLTDEYPKGLTVARSNVCLVIALRPEVLREGEGILRGQQAFVPLVDRESDHRQVVKRVHSKPVEHGDRDDAPGTPTVAQPPLPGRNVAAS